MWTSWGRRARVRDSQEWSGTRSRLSSRRNSRSDRVEQRHSSPRHGIGAIRAGIDHGLDLAEHAGRLLDADQRFEVVTPASLGVISFSYQGADPDIDTGAVNLGMVEALIEDGHAMVSSTRLGGRVVLLRLCTINPRTTPQDIESTIALLGRLGDEVAARLSG